jgi:hypothetical protein
VLLGVAAAGAGVTVAQVLVQWGQGSSNIFGANGANLCFGMFGLAGFATLAWAAGIGDPVSEQHHAGEHGQTL